MRRLDHPALIVALVLLGAAGIVSLVLLGRDLGARESARSGSVSSGEAYAGCTAQCHSPSEGASDSVHAGISCDLCHGGDPSGTNVLDAHRGLEVEAGALRSVSTTCGRCHAEEAARVEASLMATARGIIAVDRWAFGELSEEALTTHEGHDETMLTLLAEPSPSPAEDHLRRLCAGCHLHTTRENRDDAVIGTGSGCGACHLDSSHAGAHPAIDGVVPDERCLGCHSRSARISLSYGGLAEVSGSFAAACATPALLHDGRAGCRQPADVHFEAGMACTDCHVHTELMGDGRRYDRERDAVEIRCETCHGDARGNRPVRAWAEVDDAITQRILRRRGQTRAPGEPVLVATRGAPLWNVRSVEGGWVLMRKRDGRQLAIPSTPTDEPHQQAGHERLGCQACHSGWAPTCPSCHTSFDPAGQQWDFGTRRAAPGRWVERNDGMGVSAPEIGMWRDGATLGPVVPGMDATIDARAAGGALREVHRRAAFDPHTTQRGARACADCHPLDAPRTSRTAPSR